MKKLHILVMCMAAAVVACTQDPGVNTTDKGVSFSGGVSTGKSTRLAMNQETDGLSYSWEAAKDKIGIYASTASGTIKTNAQYSATQSAANSAFEPVSAADNIMWSKGAHDFYAYYPYNAAAGFDPKAVPVAVPAVQEQKEDGDFSHLPTGAFIYAKAEGATESAGGVNLMFKNLFSTLEIKVSTESGSAKIEGIVFRSTDNADIVSFSGATVDLSTGAINMTNATGTPQVKTTFATPPTITPEGAKFYMTISPGHAGKTFKVYAVIDDAEIKVAEVTAPAEGGIPVGVNAVIDVTVPAQTLKPAINLSNPQPGNTYIVNRAGQEYRFNATIKGNGIERNYEWKVGDVQYNKSFTASDLTLEPSEAGVLWYMAQQTSGSYNSTCPVVIESVRLENGYIYFTTPETFQNGNAIIDAWDEKGINEGEIIWSWTIWAVEDYDAEASVKSLNDEWFIMDRNLGATLASDTGITNGWEVSGISGNFYMWGRIYMGGRKAPFPPATDLNDNGGGRGGWGIPALTPIERYQIPNTIGLHGWGNTLPVIVLFDNGDRFRYLENELGPGYTTEQAIQFSIKNPFRWLYNGTNGTPHDPYHWWGHYGGRDVSVREEWRYMWGAPTHLMVPKKSIYDPCPPGWKVPTSSVNWALNSDEGKAKSENGWGVYYPKFDVLIPIAGFRGAHGGHVREVKNEFHLYNSNMVSDDATGSLFRYDLKIDSFGQPTFYPGSAYSAWGYQIRCMKDFD